MKGIFIFLLLFGAGGCGSMAFGQTTNNSFHAEMLLREDSMKTYAVDMINAHEATERFQADSMFTRMLVRALKVNHSFSYPFDSLQTVSRLYAPDSSFRIFTWQLVQDEASFRRHGAIQMKTADGSLLLFPLIDKTQQVDNIQGAVTGNTNWIGAIYYKIIQTSYQQKKFYTLLGYDEHSFRSTKKRIEVLTFDNGKPVFGGPYFSFEQDTVPKPVQYRFEIEYKKDGNASIKYDEELGMIIYDHLISKNDQPGKAYTYVPDGDYEGFKWVNGKWLHIEKVFTFKLEDGQAPVERPVRGGKLDLPAGRERKRN
ncbi:MAG TPA: hypothetical protein PKV73_11030 [Agriterribacter sp.]|nr:hypothetical protein [Agriterribacter sp.]